MRRARSLEGVHLKRVIPCLDVDAGRVVKGTNFVDIRDAGDPVELAERYDAEGADELVFLDITATHEKRDTMVELARRTADNVFVPFTIGGGIRSVADAQAVLDAGRRQGQRQLGGGRAARSCIDELAERFGAQCVVLAIDAKRERRRRGRSSWPAGARRPGATRSPGRARATERGAGEILLTSMDRDGTNDGYDLALTSAVADAVSVPVIASGGAGDARPPLRSAARGRRRGAVRLDLPLRPAHGGRGQGAPGRRRHRGACIATRRPRLPSGQRLLQQGEGLAGAVCGARALLSPAPGRSRQFDVVTACTHATDGRSATPEPPLPSPLRRRRARGGLDVDHAGRRRDRRRRRGHACVSRLWQAGTVMATAMTPVIVALVKEGVERPAQARQLDRHSRRTAAGGARDARRGRAAARGLRAAAAGVGPTPG